MTFERVAASAQCSVHSLHAAFGGRDELLHVVFILDVEAVLAAPRKSFEDTVRRLYRLLADALESEPRVLPAMMAQALARPHDANVQAVLRYSLPRLLASIGQWLTEEIAAGRVRATPPLLLMQQMSSPILRAPGRVTAVPAPMPGPAARSPSGECDAGATAGGSGRTWRHSGREAGAPGS
ncbi:hypothetical protein ACIOC2_09085 [Streptomyces sp. NPDC088337]|uniref:hypothetical protein n=1 Tax=unclassified Streptomyces TaxID=2593676 RepID=UPI002DDA4A07|nr:hypothetical protein [Streptomyces sp. NBC_01788]WSB28561.1 hypothetical protein OIE49_23210 [Streptomyces sp. NBC_01788]